MYFYLGLWSRTDLLAFGLDDVVELPAAVTDVGLKTLGIIFETIKKLSIYNCPHLVKPTLWFKSPGRNLVMYFTKVDLK